MEGSTNSSDSSSHSSSATRQLESPVPPQLSMELDKPGEALRRAAVGGSNSGRLWDSCLKANTSYPEAKVRAIAP